MCCLSQLSAYGCRVFVWYYGISSMHSWICGLGCGFQWTQCCWGDLNFRSTRWYQHPIFRLRNFVTSNGRMSYRLVNRGSVSLWQHPALEKTPGTHSRVSNNVQQPLVSSLLFRHVFFFSIAEPHLGGSLFYFIYPICFLSASLAA